uniref:ShKT domain-containing protein n=1 Tax=Panagrolaimus sp. ES5 TaxID=591445 RepID=A0AC34G6T2_9BILA
MKPFGFVLIFGLILFVYGSQDEFGENIPDSSENGPPPPPPSPRGGNVKLRCTDNHLKLYHNATTCHDERSAESCKMIFAQSLSSNPASRDPRCDDPLMEDIANQCRKSCGICCEDENYSCNNDNTGIVNCEQNVEKCGMKEFAPMMIKYCPATCGLCLTRKCRDQLDDCASMKTLCNNDLYAVFMEHQCAKTCGKCATDNTKVEGTISEEITDTEEPEIAPISIPKSTKCVDLMKHCAKNKKFCNHPSYIEMMTKNCAKTCGKCGSDSKPLGGSSNKKGRPGFGGKGGKGRRADCKDKHEFCKSWVKNGFCESSEYTEDYKRETCAKSCGLC